jgi:hypothetical protein
MPKGPAQYFIFTSPRGLPKILAWRAACESRLIQRNSCVASHLLTHLFGEECLNTRWGKLGMKGWRRNEFLDVSETHLRWMRQAHLVSASQEVSSSTGESKVSNRTLSAAVAATFKAGAKFGAGEYKIAVENVLGLSGAHSAQSLSAVEADSQVFNHAGK